MMLRIGLVGCGSWGRFILRDLLALGCEVWVVAKCFENIDEHYQSSSVHMTDQLEELPCYLDGYIVATPTALHAEVIYDLIDRKRPLFVEKPLVHDPIVAAKIADLAPDRIFVMDKWRYHPGINAIRDLVNTQELGKLKELHLKRLQLGCRHTDVDPLWTLLPHDLSIVLHLLQHIPKARFAVGQRDQQNAMQGVLAILEGEPRVILEVSAMHPQYERSLVATFDHGVAAMMDPNADHILVFEKKPESSSYSKPHQRSIATALPLLLELKSFLAFLNGGPPPVSSVKEGAFIVKRLAEIEAMARSDK